VKNPKTLDEISQLEKEGNAAELKKRLAKWTLAFGTAGVRVRMGAGFDQLNDLTIIILSHAFAQHLWAEKAGQCDVGVVLGYDGRHNSKRF
jgi:phosphomannomutase